MLKLVSFPKLAYDWQLVAFSGYFDGAPVNGGFVGYKMNHSKKTTRDDINIIITLVIHHNDKEFRCRSA